MSDFRTTPAGMQQLRLAFWYLFLPCSISPVEILVPAEEDPSSIRRF